MAGNTKRQRQRQNRAQAQAARIEAAQAVRKRQTVIRTAVLGTLVVALAVLAALVASRGDDDKDVAATDASTTSTSAASSTTATTGAATTTSNPAVAPPTSATPTSAPPTTATTKPGGGVTCNDTTPPKAGNGKTYPKAPDMTIDKAKKYTATMETSCGTIVIELEDDNAPKTVNNFVFLAREKFYDGLTWHRIVDDFVIQGGDPKGDGTGDPGYKFEDELPKDGYQIGSLAMANSGPDTNGSQFFVVTGEKGAALPSSYSRFGKVTKGVDVAQKLESFADPASPNDAPSRKLYILSVVITESAG